MAATIELNGTKYPMKFGYGAVRILGDKWNLTGPAKVFDKFSQLEPESFDQFEFLAGLICAGITNAGEEAPDLFDVVDEVMANPHLIEGVMQEFQKRLPQGNPQPAPKGRKKGK